MQQCLLVMLEKIKESVDKGNELGALLMDVSKAFDCTDHELLIAKLFWYEVRFSYLSNRTQSVTTKTSYSDKSNIENGVPRGSILRPLFFNIDFTDHLFEYDDYEARYVDYTTPYFCVDDIPSVATLVQPRAIEFFLVYQYQ